MERPIGFFGLAVIAAIVIAGACHAESGALQGSGTRVMAPAPATRNAPAGAAAALLRRVADERLTRAVTDHDQHEAIQARCLAPMPFAAPAPWPPAC